MNPHPSLSAQFEPPQPLAPVRKMDNPYVPCWCGSGKKWKWCHKDRENQQPGHTGAHAHDMRTEFANGAYCSHPEASHKTCGERIVRAHTIQRKGGLAAITENGHVISVKAGFEDIFKNEGEIVPRAISARDASTFTGFCDRHDNEMFKPVETGEPVLNEEAAFLLSFRALAYELFMKQSALRCIPIQRENDKGKPFDAQCFIQQHIHAYEHGLKRGLDDVTRWKSEYDVAFVDKRFDSFRFYSVAFSEVLPVVACGAFHPEFDFNSHPLQQLGRGEAPFGHLTYNLTDECQHIANGIMCHNIANTFCIGSKQCIGMR